MRIKALVSAVAVGIALGGSALAADDSQTYQIAGLTPSMRPAGAPVIQAVMKDSAWYERALTGVEPPYPASLYFLEHQGNWFNPFTVPGMPGQYDIRHWHKK